MSQEKNQTTAPGASFADKSTPSQAPAEVSGENIQTENRLLETAADTEEPTPETPSGNAVLAEGGKQMLSKDFEEQPTTGEGSSSTARTISDRKQAANRENAKRSTGPKTTEGKAASSRNSYKHGIFSCNMAREERERSAFEAVLDAIAEHYQPVGFMEKFMVEKLTTETIRFSHLLAYEQQELHRTRDPFWGEGVDRVLRYQATINKQFFQAIEQLERLQANRREEQNSPNKRAGKSETGVSEPANARPRHIDATEAEPSDNGGEG